MPHFNKTLRLALLALMLAANALAAAQTSRPLNDTGIAFCGTALSGNNAPCLGTEPLGQDAHYGRDAQAAAGQLGKSGGGEGGFDFTALDAAGQPTTPSAGATPHPCVKDNVTGLVWEVKTDDGGLRDKDWTYTWGDREIYVAAVNAARLCGYTDWRMPTRLELQSIVHAGRKLPSIDVGYFPNTPSSFFWSASPVAKISSAAWGVYFDIGGTSYVSRSDGHSVRLVRGGQ